MEAPGRRRLPGAGGWDRIQVQETLFASVSCPRSLSLHSGLPSPPPPHCCPPAGVRWPKFSWEEGQKRLPLIGCVLLLIALVVSLIVLCEYGEQE